MVPRRCWLVLLLLGVASCTRDMYLGPEQSGLPEGNNNAADAADAPDATPDAPGDAEDLDAGAPDLAPDDVEPEDTEPDDPSDEPTTLPDASDDPESDVLSSDTLVTDAADEGEVAPTCAEEGLDTCAARSGAAPVCRYEEGGCEYACVAAQVDLNGDLQGANSDGCECTLSGQAPRLCDTRNDTCTDEADTCCADGELVHRADRQSMGTLLIGQVSLSPLGGSPGLGLAWVERTSTGFMVGPAFFATRDQGGRPLTTTTLNARAYEARVVAMPEGAAVVIRSQQSANSSVELIVLHHVAGSGAPTTLLLEESDTVESDGFAIAGGARGAGVVWEHFDLPETTTPRCEASPPSNCLVFAWTSDGTTATFPSPVRSVQNATIHGTSITIVGQSAVVSWLERSQLTLRTSLMFRIFDIANRRWMGGPELVVTGELSSVWALALGEDFGLIYTEIRPVVTTTLNRYSAQGGVQAVVPFMPALAGATLVTSLDGASLTELRQSSMGMTSRRLELDGLRAGEAALLYPLVQAEAPQAMQLTPWGGLGLFSVVTYSQPLGYAVIDVVGVDPATSAPTCALPGWRWEGPE